MNGLCGILAISHLGAPRRQIAHKQANLREFVELPSSWPPARVEVGSELQFTTSFPVDPVDPVDPLDPVPCRKVVFRIYETLTFENHI